MSESKPTNNSTKYLIVLIFALLACVFFIYQYYTLSNENKSLQNQFIDKQQELELLDIRLNKAKDSLIMYKGINAELDSIIDMKVEELNSMKKAIDGKNFSISELRRKLKQVESIQQATMARLDSFIIANKLLTNENLTLYSNLKTEREKANSLQMSNEFLSDKVKKAEILVASNIRCLSQRKKPNGKTIETPKAKKVNRLQICLNIMKNNVTKAGKKDLYLIINGPDKKTLTIKNMGSIKIRSLGGEKELVYSIKKTFIYNNEKTELCINWEQDKAYRVGKYTCSIFNDGENIGNCSFVLK